MKIKSKYSLPITALAILIEVFLLIYTQYPYTASVHYVRIVIVISTILMATAGAFYFLIRKYSIENEHIPYGLVMLQALFFSGVVAIAFKNSDYSIKGIDGDMGFINQLVTKMAYTHSMSDGSYAGLSSFYPPLYYYLCAMTSVIFNLPPNLAVKLAFVLTAFCLPIIIWKLWKPITGNQIAAFLPLLIAIDVDLDKPASVLGMTIAIPWMLYYIENITDKRFSTRDFIVGGLLGGLIIQLQYYWILIAMVSFTIRLISEKGLKTVFPNLLIQAKKIWVIGLISVAVASVYIIPYIYDMLTIGSQPIQNRWFTDWMAWLSFSFLQFNFLGIVKLFGLGSCVYFAQSNNVSRSVLYLFAGCYVYAVIGITGAGFGIPFLHYKAGYMVEYLLCFMVVHGGLQVYSMVSLKLRARNLYLAAVSIVGFFVCQGFSMYMAEAGKYSSGVKYPTDLDSLLSAVDSNKLSGKIILTNQDSIPVFFPVNSFITSNPGYSHPSALYEDRAEFLLGLNSIHDPEVLATAIMNNKFGQIDYLINKKVDPFFGAKLWHDNFPFPMYPEYLVLPFGRFESKWFNVSEFGKFRVIKVINSNNPLAESNIANTPSLKLAANDLVMKAYVGKFINRVATKTENELVEVFLKSAGESNINPGTILEAVNKLPDSTISRLNLDNGVAKKLASIISSIRQKAINRLKVEPIIAWEAEKQSSDWEQLDLISNNIATENGKASRHINSDLFNLRHPAGNALFFTDFVSIPSGTYNLEVNWTSSLKKSGIRAGYIEAISDDMTQIYNHYDLISDASKSGNLPTIFEINIPGPDKKVRIRYYHTDRDFPLDVDNFCLKIK